MLMYRYSNRYERRGNLKYESKLAIALYAKLYQIVVKRQQGLQQKMICIFLVGENVKSFANGMHWWWADNNKLKLGDLAHQA